MPAPLAIPSTFTGLSFRNERLCKGQLGPRVGGHDGVGEGSNSLLRRLRVPLPVPAEFRHDLLHRQRNADNAGGRRKHLAGADFQQPASSRQTCWQACMPALPVAQLALPEFTITARTLPRLAANDARPTSRGAATTRFFVNTAAAVVPGQASTSARSGRPLALIPAQAAEKAEPRGQAYVVFGDETANFHTSIFTSQLVG